MSSSSVVPGVILGLVFNPIFALYLGILIVGDPGGHAGVILGLAWLLLTFAALVISASVEDGWCLVLVAAAGWALVPLVGVLLLGGHPGNVRIVSTGALMGCMLAAVSLVAGASIRWLFGHSAKQSTGG